MREIDIFGVPQVEETIVPSMPYMGSKRKLSPTNNAKVTIEKVYWNGRNLQ